MVAYKIDPQKTALLVFDMATHHVESAPDIRENLVPRLKRLIAHCRSKDIPVIYALHVHRKDGSDLGIMGQIIPGLLKSGRFVKGTEAVQVYEELKPQEGEIVIEKCRFSAFNGTDLEIILKSMGKDTLIVTGAITGVGCESTARDAADREFKVIFPSDGNASRNLPDMGWGPMSKEEIQRAVLTLLAYRFARVLTVDELIAELR